jgi:hypothetical protein
MFWSPCVCVVVVVCVCVAFCVSILSCSCCFSLELLLLLCVGSVCRVLNHYSSISEDTNSDVLAETCDIRRGSIVIAVLIHPVGKEANVSAAVIGVYLSG